MSALPLLDFALSSAASGQPRAVEADEPLVRLAASLVHAVSEDIERVAMFERGVHSPGDEGAPFDRDVAVMVRFSYEECVRHAEQILERVTRLESRGHKIAGADELRDARARLSAMLAVSLDELAVAQEQAARAQTRPAAELRHDLRTRVHK